MPEAQILMSFWDRRPDGAWAVNGLQGMTLKPKGGEPDSDLFEINDYLFLVQPNIMGTIHTFLGESIVPIVSRVHGESLLRCIGTGFFISCRWLIPLSQVRPYLVISRSRLADFARRRRHPAAFPSPSFCDAALV